MSRFFFFFFLFGLDEKLERKGREREREKKREDLPYYYDEDDVFYEKYTTGKAQDSEKKGADGWSDFDFIFPRYLASCDDYTHIERESDCKKSTLPCLAFLYPFLTTYMYLLSQVDRRLQVPV